MPDLFPKPYPLDLVGPFGDPYRLWVRKIGPAPNGHVSLVCSEAERLTGTGYTVMVAPIGKLPADLVAMLQPSEWEATDD
jgi:hypothetical protein